MISGTQLSSAVLFRISIMISGTASIFSREYVYTPSFSPIFRISVN